jgi:four helix bundle protein
MENRIRSYEDLDVWKLGIELTLRIYSMVAMLPPSERFELSAQMRRSAVSIPSNIAEGHARRQSKPYLNHVNIALGSLAELNPYLLLAMRLGFINAHVFEEEQRETAQLGRMLHGLATSLERRINQRRLGFTFGVGAWFLATAALF